MDWPSRFEVFEGQGKITVGGYVEVRGEDVRIENVGTRAGWEDEEVGLLACPVVARANGMNQGLSEEREIAKMGGVMPDAEVLTVSGIAELNGESQRRVFFPFSFATSLQRARCFLAEG